MAREGSRPRSGSPRLAIPSADARDRADLGLGQGSRNRDALLLRRVVVGTSWTEACGSGSGRPRTCRAEDDRLSRVRARAAAVRPRIPDELQQLRRPSQPLDIRRQPSRRAAVHGGKIGVREGIRFASGSGFFLSRDLVELVVEHRDEWGDSLDDVALASVLARYGVEPVEAPRQDLVTLADLGRLDLSHFHFRCKSTLGAGRDDRLIMLAVHRAFCRRRGAPVASRARAAARVALVRVERSVRWRLRRRSIV